MIFPNQQRSQFFNITNVFNDERINDPIFNTQTRTAQ